MDLHSSDTFSHTNNIPHLFLLYIRSVGFIIGMFLCLIIMGVISSSVFAAIVLFAEAPAEFESNHPEHSSEMRQAYLVAHPGCM